MRVLLLGAAGIIGQSIAPLLAKDGHDLALADLRQDRVVALAKELEVEAIPLDVTDVQASVKVLKGYDLALNSTWYYYNLQVMEACLAGGCNYLDLGGLYHTTLKQLQLGPKFEGAGLLALLGCGKAPGITNILAAWGSRHFESLGEVHLRSGRRPLGENPGVQLPYSPQTLLDEFTLRPVVLREGQLREVDPLSGREVVGHPPPFGDIEYITTLHSELATLPAHLGRGLRDMEFKVALPRATTEAIQQLVHLGFAARQPVQVAGGQVSPRDLTVAVLSAIPQPEVAEVWITEVEMVGERHGRPLRALLRVTGDGGQNGTASAAAVAAHLVARGIVKGSGVHAPEGAIPPEEFLGRLQSHGLGVSETLVETRGLES